MEAHDRPGTTDLLSLLAIPTDGRLLTFGAETATLALSIAAARPDTLIVACDASNETTRRISDQALADRLHNIIVGDTPAGPLVDRALCVDGLTGVEPQHLIMVRSAILPGGYAIFVETGAPAADSLVEKLKAVGYTVADPLEDALAGATVVRAR
jgi:hypothetical protein